MECNIGQDALFVTHSEIFMYIYKGRLVEISTNIASLFYKEIYMKLFDTIL